jgi:hypothetical protein
MTAPAQTTLPALSVADRCDRCGAQAFVRVVLRAGELLFCGHHARQNAPALQDVALQVEDGTGAINTRPSPSAY